MKMLPIPLQDMQSLNITVANLFKRLESSGEVFLQSLERHILRNYIFLYAIEHNKPLPLGQQDAAMLDTRIYDEDADATTFAVDYFDDDDENDISERVSIQHLHTPEAFRKRAAQLYAESENAYKTRFKWIRPALFDDNLTKNLQADALALIPILSQAGT